MAILTTNYQLIATGQAQRFNVATGYLELWAKYGSQDIVNNKTNDVSWEVRLVVTGGYIGDYSGTSFNISPSDFNGYTISKGTGNFNSQTLGSVSGNVVHLSDGKKAVSCSASIRFNAWGQTLTVNGSCDLPDIPRASTISVPATTYDIGDTIVITDYKKVSAYTDKIKISFSAIGTSQKYEKYITENASMYTNWNTALDAAEMYKIIPDLISGNCTITVETYSGNSLIGTNGINIILFVTNANPIFNNFTYEDINPKTIPFTFE